ncbi:MAG: hypothetical protein CVU57_06800 [Deltaproteobacteria bacterium HGW-Deltaproteobacteria-15]|nr:MAG: hypothetical protein CVU57_06800 [Deltaproteobacteria bacterium HGW-Deltaproteobacteria-15]
MRAVPIRHTQGRASARPFLYHSSIRLTFVPNPLYYCKSRGSPGSPACILEADVRDPVTGFDLPGLIQPQRNPYATNLPQAGGLDFTHF